MKDSKSNIVYFSIGLVIFLLTFPSFVITHYNGLDASYFWALNYFFADYKETFGTLIYPFGPLGFLKSPFFIGANYQTGIIFYSLVRGLLVSFLLILSRKNKLKVTYAAGVILLILFFSTFDNSIIGLVLAGILLHQKTNKIWYLLVSVIISVTAVFIKSSLGLSCFSIILVYSAYQFLYKKYYLLPVWFLTLSVIGVILIGSFYGLFHFLFSTVKMISGYSSALSLFPDNNWFFLSLSLILFATIPFILRKKETYLLYALMAFASFAAWKHAIVREDIFHNRIFLDFLIIFFGFLLIITQEKKRWVFIPMLLSILFFALNMRNIPGYDKPIHFSNSPVNFYKSIINFKTSRLKGENSVNESLKVAILDNSTRSIIGDKSIDIFPWELSYIPSNSLNWKPRATLQAGAYSLWIDSISASAFLLTTGPEYVLFHFNDCPNYTKLGSLDGRYILNDEPLSILNLLSNYKIVQSTTEYALLAKRPESVFSEPKLIKRESRKWKEWIGVPHSENGILRVKFYYSEKLLAKIKSFLYKGEFFQIEYKFTDGTIYLYRFNPETAISGLWINPFIIDINKPELNKNVEFIRLSSNGQDLLDQQINLEWNVIECTDSTDLSYLENLQAPIKEPIIYSKNDFESKPDCWSWNSENHDSLKVYSGKFSNRIKRNGFSASYVIPVDSINSETGYIEFFASCQAFLNKKSNSLVVLSIEKDGKPAFWTSKSLDKLFSDSWNENQFRIFLNIDQYNGHILSFYIWNPDGDTCWIDDLIVSINN
ncbi:MAG: hypothetical protein A2W99_10860 [Bacteroidetes bacterium GWF2_33_16]|nr:MAG: hypothetical protein A2X00_04880 [Bacteroidetes bacterium GWE2_32_14]OFY04039.1 MAG: hypothetical protein A2W99_10860 [Bacteroidetes bacterium GWF2_33_16]